MIKFRDLSTQLQKELDGDENSDPTYSHDEKVAKEKAKKPQSKYNKRLHFKGRMMRSSSAVGIISQGSIQKAYYIKPQNQTTVANQSHNAPPKVANWHTAPGETRG